MGLRRLAGVCAARTRTATAATLAASFALTLATGPALGAAPAPGATPVPANPGAARLVGSFLLAGQVTSAQGVRGVHVGQNVLRTWTFTPGCAAGACDSVTLRRVRSGGSDIVVLHRVALGYYSGAGGFYAPLRCGRRIYAHGQAVPFTITVRVTAAVLFAGIDFASRVQATYTNHTRKNLTPCVAAPGHVGATYHGNLIQSAPSAGAAGT